MTNPAEPASPKRALNVLPSSGKVDQLKAEFARTQPARQLPDRTPIDDALDPALSEAQRAIRQRVIDVLKTVYDPEIPVNIFDLGLIYAIDVTDAGQVHVRMTLTAPGCPVAGTLPGEIQRKIASVDGVTDATVQLVWDPPWSKERMSEAARLELGFL